MRVFRTTLILSAIAMTFATESLRGHTLSSSRQLQGFGAEEGPRDVDIINGNKAAVAGEEDPKDIAELDKEAAAGEEDPKDVAELDGDNKAAFAGLEDPVHQSINLLRTTNGLPELTKNAALSASAAKTVELIAAAGELDHNIGGMTAFEKATEAGYEGTDVQENLYKDTCKGAAAVCGASLAQVLLANDEASQKLLDPEAKDIGTAAYKADDGTVYYVSDT